MRELALHLLDLAQNSLAAGATRLRLEIEVDREADRLRLAVEDDGRGIPGDMLERVADPFVTSRETRHVGLGLPLLKAAAERCDGRFRLSSVPGFCTRVEAEFRLSHADRAPLGDVAGTVITLVACNPRLDLELAAAWGRDGFTFSTAACRESMGAGVSLAAPVVLAYLREYLEAGLADLRRADEASAGLQWR